MWDFSECVIVIVIVVRTHQHTSTIVARQRHNKNAKVADAETSIRDCGVTAVRVSFPGFDHASSLIEKSVNLQWDRMLVWMVRRLRSQLEVIRSRLDRDNAKGVPNEWAIWLRATTERVQNRMLAI